MRWLLTLALLIPTISYGKDADHAYEIMQKTKDAIFLVQDKNAKGEVQGHATAFVIKYKGKRYTLTAAHVCEGEPKKRGFIYLKKGKKTWKTKILRTSKNTDLCLLQNPNTTESLQLAPKGKKDEYVYIVGFPSFEFMTSSFGRLKGVDEAHLPAQWVENLADCKGGMYHTHEVQQQTFLGTISVEVCFFKLTVYATSVSTDRGSSGGPLINDKAQVLGLMSFISGRAIGFGHAVPVRDIKKFLKLK